MMEDEAVCVQKRAIETRQRTEVARQVPSNPAVQRIADHRVTDGVEMNANLVRPAGCDRHVNQ